MSGRHIYILVDAATSQAREPVRIQLDDGMCICAFKSPETCFAFREAEGKQNQWWLLGLLAHDFLKIMHKFHQNRKVTLFDVDPPSVAEIRPRPLTAETLRIEIGIQDLAEGSPPGEAWVRPPPELE